ncbi:M48 family metallopeptidase [Alsobacter sp. SYSU M60028]|uniref:M48 family metallopeptidase n=1 Tax=Alsobacter ponti TaxID=2962936 RepID=A0ABT1LHA4_9HYPH|nr:M48 family metallopeptidase [Alsobacter ponti]MCP8940834.1 M48 family metallopeptidase [Alsobacter ponti]
MIEGRYFPPESARSIDATLRAGPAGLLLRLGDGAEAAAPRIVAVSPPVGSLPRKIEFADGAVFEAAHDADLSALPRPEGKVASAVHWIERNALAVALACVLAVAAVAAFYQWGLPALARGLASVTPPGVSAAIDAAARQTFEGTLLKPSRLPEARQEALRRQMAALGESAGLPPADLLLRDAPSIGPNAFALPGGTVILTDQLVQAARTDDEVLGVLAHEMGHVELRHGLRRIYAAAGLYAFVAVLGGDPGPLVETLATQAGVLRILSYSRDFEREADRRGVEIMLAAGRDPTAFVVLIGRLSGAAGRDGATILDTHPGAAEREAEVRAHARALGWRG